MNTIALVILNLNEIEGVRHLGHKMVNHEALFLDEIIVMDGGSTDGSSELFTGLGFRVIQQSSPGRGSAMREASMLTDAEYLIFFSPDGNEDWRDIPKFKGFFTQGYDLVIASRMMKGAINEEDSSFFRIRKWANNIFNYAFSSLCTLR